MQRKNSLWNAAMYAVKETAVSQRKRTVFMSMMNPVAIGKKNREAPVLSSVRYAAAKHWKKRIPKQRHQKRKPKRKEKSRTVGRQKKRTAGRNVFVGNYAKRAASILTVLYAVRKAQTFPSVKALPMKAVKRKKKRQRLQSRKKRKQKIQTSAPTIKNIRRTAALFRQQRAVRAALVLMSAASAPLRT